MTRTLGGMTPLAVPMPVDDLLGLCRRPGACRHHVGDPCISTTWHGLQIQFMNISWKNNIFNSLASCCFRGFSEKYA